RWYSACKAVSVSPGRRPRGPMRPMARGPVRAVQRPTDKEGDVMAQSLAKVYLHVIFSTKNREPLLLDDWRDELFRVMGGAANNLGCQSLIVGGTVDHVHMLIQLGRTITMADAIGKIKSTSSAWVNQNHAGATPFHWQAGY